MSETNYSVKVGQTDTQLGSNYPLIKKIAEVIEDHYNIEPVVVSYENKIVLDLGASNGDSAEYFLHKGAILVVAVEGALEYQSKKTFEELLKNSQLFNGKLIPIFLFIENPKQIEDLIVAYKPDFIKSDIEGAEIHLYNIKDEIWRMVPEYLVETHEGYLGGNLHGLMHQKCEKTKYKVLYDATKIAHIIYAKRED